MFVKQAQLTLLRIVSLNISSLCGAILKFCELHLIFLMSHTRQKQQAHTKDGKQCCGTSYAKQKKVRKVVFSHLQKQRNC